MQGGDVVKLLKLALGLTVLLAGLSGPVQADDPSPPSLMERAAIKPFQPPEYLDFVPKVPPVNPTNRQRYKPAIQRIARQYKVEPALVHAVISAESGYDPAAVSHAGAMGMMQLMPATARMYGIDDPFDPVANIQGGTRHLGKLLRRYNNISLALAAYNAGEGAVASYNNNIPNYPETRRYVIRVIDYYQRYRQAGYNG